MLRWYAPALAVAILVIGVAAIVRHHSEGTRPVRSAAATTLSPPREDDRPPPQAEPAFGPAQATSAPLREAATIRNVQPMRDERSIMAQLHALGETEPAASLALAREGNDRFPHSEAAPERAWIVVRSLVRMTRFDEAKVEATRMVEAFPGTPWAGDVRRHLLVNPLYPGDGQDPR